MVQTTKKKLELVIPNICPVCEFKLKHVNALDTEAEVYFVYCPNTGCRWCREYKKCPNCGELICL